MCVLLGRPWMHLIDCLKCIVWTLTLVIPAAVWVVWAFSSRGFHSPKVCVLSWQGAEHTGALTPSSMELWGWSPAGDCSVCCSTILNPDLVWGRMGFLSKGVLHPVCFSTSLCAFKPGSWSRSTTSYQKLQLTKIKLAKCKCRRSIWTGGCVGSMLYWPW